MVKHLTMVKKHPVVKGQSDTTTRVACNIIHVFWKELRMSVLFIIIIIIIISIH